VFLHKLSFRQQALIHMQTFSDLSDEAKELTVRLYAFIKKKNDWARENHADAQLQLRMTLQNDN
jgi:hypothetical protein